MKYVSGNIYWNYDLLYKQIHVYLLEYLIEENCLLMAQLSTGVYFYYLEKFCTVQL